MYQRRRSRKRQKNLLKMGDFLPKLLKSKKLAVDILDYRITDVWYRAVGPQISAQTIPVKFKNHTLYVNVSTPAWMQQLHFMKQEILDKVYAEWGNDEIRNIHFAIGNIPSGPMRPKDHISDFNPRLLKERDKRLIRENLSQIRDTELKAILKKVMTREIIKRRLND
jgi:predicted nucleic acid-binding Zn ribbon protein